MLRYTVILFLSIFAFSSFSQSLSWSSFVDSIPTLSSPRPVDLNNDGVLDLVFGGGTDGQSSLHGVMAYNGIDGSLLWELSTRNEVFGSAVFEDINADGVKDVFINGREAQLLAIDGFSGNLIWDFFPYGTNPADSGFYNFYNPLFIDDISGDGVPDLLVANGGDHAAPDWETNRPPGHLMVLNSMDGSVLAKAVVPDSAETYCSPVVVDLQNNGQKWVLYGTGGENIGGSFWACPLSDLLNNSLLNSVAICSSNDKGYIAPASFFKKPNNTFDFIVQSYSGLVQRFDGTSLQEIWSFSLTNTESSAAPVIGNFTGGDMVPDVFLSLFKGTSPSYSDFYQVLLDGASGNLVFMDSIGTLAYASGAAMDINNDGRDEAFLLITNNDDGYFKTVLTQFDFQNNVVSEVLYPVTGVNLGCTPLFYDSNQDSLCEIAFTVKKDSINPVAWNGVYLHKIDLASLLPNAGIAWGGYMGNYSNGNYHYAPVDCGQGSIFSGATIVSPSCNLFEDGSIDPVVSFENVTYVWSNGSTDSLLQNLGAGTYWVRATNNLGCFEERSVTLVDPYVVSYGGVFPPTCIGDTNGVATVSSTGCPCQFSNCTFLWDNGVTTKPNTTLSSGWHFTTINYPDGCVSYDSVFIPEPLPVVDSSVVIVPICFGSSDGALVVYENMDFAPHEFVWNTLDTTSQITNLASGAYSVVVKDARVCTDTLYFNLLEPEQISFVYSIQNPFCFNESSGSISFDSVVGGAGNYAFYVNNLLTSFFLDSLSAGSYTLQVQDSVGCLSSLMELELFNPNPLSVSFDINPVSSEEADDASISVVVVGGEAPYSYSLNGSSNVTNSLFSNVSSGWAFIEVMDANGCFISDSVFIGTMGLSFMDNEFSLFPNPTNETIWLSTQQPLYTRENFFVEDIHGRNILHGFIDSSLKSIDVSRLNPGVYYLHIKNALFKFIVE